MSTETKETKGKVKENPYAKKTYGPFVGRALKESRKGNSHENITLRRSFGRDIMDALQGSSDLYPAFLRLYPVIRIDEGWTERKAAQFFTAQLIMFTRSTETGAEKRRLEQVLARMYANESAGIKARILKILSLDMDETGCLERTLSELIRMAVSKGYSMKNLNFEQLIYDLATWNRHWTSGSRNRWGETICRCVTDEPEEETTDVTEKESVAS